MGIEITLRTDSYTSYFKKNLKKLIKTPHSNTLLLSSGFFQESILYDRELVNLINNHCSKVILIGAHTTHRDTTDATYKNYSCFSRYLVYNTKNVEIETYMGKKKRWHGKIALKINDQTPLVGLMGSSNLTAPAYENDYFYFNYETDVLIWSKEIDDFFKRKPSEEDTQLEELFSPMIAELKEGVIQKDEKKRLKDLYNTIISSSILESVNFFSAEESKVIEAIKKLEANPNADNFRSCGNIIDLHAPKLSEQCCNYIRTNFIDSYISNINSINFIPKDMKPKVVEVLESLKTKLAN